MTSAELDSADAVRDWLQSHARGDFRLTAPYARRWYNGGCSPTHSLYGARDRDLLQVLCEGVLGLGVRVKAAEGGAELNLPGGPVVVAVSTYLPEEGPPSDYGLFEGRHPEPSYVCNSPTVVVELLRRLGEPAPALPVSDLVQVGFPGAPTTEVTYVGCWQWDIHSEARTPEFVERAAQAIIDAISTKESGL